MTTKYDIADQLYSAISDRIEIIQETEKGVTLGQLQSLSEVYARVAGADDRRSGRKAQPVEVL